MDVLFVMSIFRLYPGLKSSVEHKSDNKNLSLNAFFSWDARLSLRRMDQKFKIGGTIVMGTRSWSSYFVILTFLDDMQHYMMLLEQYRNRVAKVLATIT